jgi:hypothetical protein
MRTFLALAVGIAALTLGGLVLAEEKAKKLEGKLCCTKCHLQETDKCGHCLKVKDGDKEVKYYLDDKGGAEEYHKKVCKEEKDATVEGKVTEKDKKMHVESPKVTVK